MKKKCLECGYVDMFRKKYKKIKQNIEICTVCGTEIDINIIDSVVEDRE